MPSLLVIIAPRPVMKLRLIKETKNPQNIQTEAVCLHTQEEELSRMFSDETTY